MAASGGNAAAGLKNTRMRGGLPDAGSRIMPIESGNPGGQNSGFDINRLGVKDRTTGSASVAATPGVNYFMTVCFGCVIIFLNHENDLSLVNTTTT